MKDLATKLALVLAATPLFVLIRYAFTDTQTGQLLLIGALPFLLIVAAAIGVGLTYLSAKFTIDDMGEIMIAVGTILMVSVVVMVFVTQFSGAIRPYEQFADISGLTVLHTENDEIQQLLVSITEAEADVCNLITRTDKFIQSDVGKAGSDNPALVAQAQEKARAAVGGPLTDCGASWPDVSGAAALTEAANRLTRMEATLKSFTEPELESTYNRTVPCQEGFADVSGESVLAPLKARLAAVQTTIQTQKTKYLKPIDDKNAALQRGEVSDCDKKRGAKVAVTASVTGKTPNKG